MKESVLKQISIVLFCLLIQGYGLQESLAVTKDKENTMRGIRLGTTTLYINGTYRIRGEVQDKFNVKTYGIGTKEDYVISRLRLHLDLRFQDVLQFFTEIQDAEVLGLSFKDSDFSPNNNPYHDPFDINKAYITLQPIKGIELRVGRQSISFGDRMIFGPGDWGNTGRYAWDAVFLRFDNEHINSNWLVGRYIIHDPDRWPNKHVAGPTAYATYSTVKKLPFVLDIFYVLKTDSRGVTKGEKGVGNLSSHSLGFRVDGQHHRWDYGSTVVSQFGNWGADEIRAYGLVFHLGYTFNVAWRPHLIAQYVKGSGDKEPNDGKHGTFDGIFGGSDTILYGWMNLFFWPNLREHRLDLILTPEETTTFRAEYHYFMLDEAKDAWYYPSKAQRMDKTGSSGRELGQELDFSVRKKVSNHLELLGGYSFFVPGEFIENTGDSPKVHWYFLETTLSF